MRFFEEGELSTYQGMGGERWGFEDTHVLFFRAEMALLVFAGEGEPSLQGSHVRVPKVVERRVACGHYQ